MLCCSYGNRLAAGMCSSTRIPWRKQHSFVVGGVNRFRCNAAHNESARDDELAHRQDILPPELRELHTIQRLEIDIETSSELWQQGVRNQQEWDAARNFAIQKFEKGELPYWVSIKWLNQRLAPENEEILQLLGLSAVQFLEHSDNKAPKDPSAQKEADISPSNQGSEGSDAKQEAGGGDGSGDGDGGDGLGKGKALTGGDDGDDDDGFGQDFDDWWEGIDFYNIMRRTASHPMQLWTYFFAAFLAVTGVVTSLLTRRVESLHWGVSCAALLLSSAIVMGNMYDMLGVLGVKVAFGVCALLAMKELWAGWEHWTGNARRRGHHLAGTGWSCVLMCLGYVMGGMAGLEEYALPTTPGAVYKSSDIARKQQVWEAWGYGNAYMR